MSSEQRVYFTGETSAVGSGSCAEAFQSDCTSTRTKHVRCSVLCNCKVYEISTSLTPTFVHLVSRIIDNGNVCQFSQSIVVPVISALSSPEHNTSSNTALLYIFLPMPRGTRPLNFPIILPTSHHPLHAVLSPWSMSCALQPRQDLWLTQS